MVLASQFKRLRSVLTQSSKATCITLSLKRCSERRVWIAPLIPYSPKCCGSRYYVCIYRNSRPNSGKSRTDPSVSIQPPLNGTNFNFASMVVLCRVLHNVVSPIACRWKMLVVYGGLPSLPTKKQIMACLPLVASNIPRIAPLIALERLLCLVENWMDEKHTATGYADPV